MNYRNKTIFDWNLYEENNISSLLSLKIMKILKSNLCNIPIKNIIIRDIHDQVGIIIQTKIYNLNNFVNILNTLNKKFIIKFFAIQFDNNGLFEKNKNKNIIYLKDKFITFNINYVDEKKIFLLPDSFFQSNLKVLNQYYEFFIKNIKISECKNIINIGDDGGNICTILYSLFNNLISYFHCISSYKCANEMINYNNLINFNITFNIDDLIDFSNINKNIILFINPGRKGLKNNEMEFIIKSDIKSIIYMACNNEQFLKDLEIINLHNFTYIQDKISILSMPIINKEQNLYYLIRQ